MKEANADADVARAVFGQACADCYEQVHRYVLKLTRNRADADDLVQGGVEHAFDYMERNGWQPEVKSVKAFLCTIATNLCRDMWKKRKGETQMIYDGEDGEQLLKALARKSMQQSRDFITSTEDGIYFEERCRRTPWHVILHELSEYEMQLLNLNAIKDLSVTEIADAVGKDVSIVRYDLQKLYARLRARARTVVRAAEGGDPQKGKFL